MSASQTIDIKQHIDGRPVSAQQWLLVALCFLVVVADGMDVAIMGFVTPPILQEWAISRPAFGFVIGAAPFGLVLGALVAGPSSDRFGRKPVLVASILVFGALTLAAAYATSPLQMAVLRFLAGTGMGAAMPNASTLLAEYAPTRRRSLMITVMFTGFNLGSALIGFAAAAIIPVHGWRAVMLLGGAVPLALLPFLLALLPESARLLALRGAPAPRIARTLGRMTGTTFAPTDRFVTPEPSSDTRSPVGTLFAGGNARTTISLWITYFFGLLVIYLLTGWLPTMMRDAGLSISTANNVTALFQIGGTIGAILVGWAMDSLRPAAVIALAYLGGAICIGAVSAFGALSALLGATVFAAGFCMSGAQTGLNAYAPGLYPTRARATGVSWMLGMGRFGSIAGSTVGGALLGMGLDFTTVLGLLAVPALLAAIAIMASRSTQPAILAPATH